MSIEAMKLALEALEEIALAGMSGTGQESEEAMTEWHAQQAWKFISIAARQLDSLRQAIEQAEQAEQEPLGCIYLEDGSRLELDGRLWVLLTSAGEHVRYLNRYENGYINAAIKAAHGITGEQK